MIYKVLICLIAITALSECNPLESRCPYGEACRCGERTLECLCKNNENILMLSFSKYDWKRIIVKDCNFVQIRLGAFLHMKLESIEFINISKLSMRNFAFSGIAGIDNLLLKDIRNLEIGLFGFSGFEGVESIKFINVTVPNLPEFAISGSNITLFEITNSTLALESFSIIVWDMNDVMIKNTHFIIESNSSFIIRSADILEIRDSVFSSALEKTIVALWTNTVEIFNCTFQVLPSGFLAGHSDHFYFHHNVIQSSETNAFQGFSVRESAQFKFNRFQVVELDSLFPNPHNNVSETIHSLVIYGNAFHCDCRLSWLFHDKQTYSSIIHTSTCSNYKNIRLSHLYKFFYSNETCKFPGHETKQSLSLEDSQYLFQDDNSVESKASYLSAEIVILRLAFVIVLIYSRKMLHTNVLLCYGQVI